MTCLVERGLSNFEESAMYLTSVTMRSREWEKKRDLERKWLMTFLKLFDDGDAPCICIPDPVLIPPTNEEGPLQKREMDRKMVMEMGCDKRIDMKTEMACLQVVCGSGSRSVPDSKFNCGEEGKTEKELDMHTDMARLTEMVRSTETEKERLKEKEREISMEQKRLIEKLRKEQSDLEWTRETLKNLETIKGRLSKRLSESLSSMEEESLRERLREIETDALSRREIGMYSLREMERYKESFMELEREKSMERARLMERISEINKDLLRAANSYIQPPFIPPNDKSHLDERFIKVNVEQDIHSLFRVFSHQLLGHQRHFGFIRHAISTQLRENILVYGEHVSEKNENYPFYCNGVATSRGGDELCIMAACDLFRVSFVQLTGAPNAVVTEVVPTMKLRDEKHVISRKVIYSSKSNTEIHSLVLNSDQDLDDLNVRWKKIDSLKQHSNDPNVILDIYRSLLEDQPKMVVPKGDYRRHSLRLRSFGFQRKTMIGDGNCMFRSLSDQIFNSQEHHFLMRSVIVAKLKKHPSRYLKLRSLRSRQSETYDDYCYRMASNMVWGDTACIQAACDAFGVKIILLYSSGGLIFLELDPDGPCKKVIYGCSNPHHMDAMCPLAELPKEESVNDTEIDFKESLIALFKEVR